MMGGGTVKPTVAFIGLGVMGHPMAGHLAQAGYELVVYNRTATKAERWCKEFSGKHAQTASEAAASANIVITCVGDDNDLDRLYRGENGLLSVLRSGTVCIDHSTVSAQIVESLASDLSALAVPFLDAPVSGGQAGAINGVLTIMVGGNPDVLAAVRPLLDCYAKAVILLGPVGSGQRCKMVNQICIASLLQGLAEGLHFARSTGLDVEQVVEVISQGAAQSWQMENRYKTMLAGEYEHGFAVDWMRKDLAIALREAGRNGSLLPVTALVDQLYGEVQKMGGGRWDTSSLLARLEALR